MFYPGYMVSVPFVFHVKQMVKLKWHLTELLSYFVNSPTLQVGIYKLGVGKLRPLGHIRPVSTF